MADNSIQRDKKDSTLGGLKRNHMSGKLQTKSLSLSDKKFFVCTKCDKTFEKYAFWTHKLLHKERKTNCCSHCNKTFFSVSEEIATSVPMQEKGHFHAYCVGRIFLGHLAWKPTSSHIQEKGHLSAISVTKLSYWQVTWRNTYSCTQEKSLLFALSVTKPSLQQVNSRHTYFPTQGKCCLNALIVTVVSRYPVTWRGISSFIA